MRSGGEIQAHMLLSRPWAKAVVSAAYLEVARSIKSISYVLLIMYDIECLDRKAYIDTPRGIPRLQRESDCGTPYPSSTIVVYPFHMDTRS